MAFKFLKMSSKLHNSFQNIFAGGAEYRNMMHSEASAALLKVAFQCMDVSYFVAKHINCHWSESNMIIAKNLKENLMTEFDGMMNQWKKEVSVEKKKSTQFIRITLAQNLGFRAAIKEEGELMGLISGYTQLPVNVRIEVREEFCKNIAMQASTLMSALTEMVYGKPVLKSPSSIQLCLLSTPSNCNRQMTVGLASKEQKSEILNKLQTMKQFTSSAVMGLSNENLYAISYTEDTKKYCGFIFVNMPVHTMANLNRDARITYVEILPDHRKSLLAKGLLSWIQTSARDNGYVSLYSESLVPSESFWIKCGFKVQKERGCKLAIYDMNPMNIENLVNWVSV